MSTTTAVSSTASSSRLDASSARASDSSNRPVTRSASAAATRRVEETESTRIERLGRERPPQFKTLWSEAAFCYSIFASQFMAEYFVSGFNVLIPTLLKELNIPANGAVWPAASFALVTSAFLVPLGRVADRFGGRRVFRFGLIWFCALCFVAGFSQNGLMLNWCRALQGIGPAAFLPSGLMLLGKAYRPGPRKNMVYSIYGSSAPLGFFFGVLIAGLSASTIGWSWYFWIGAALVLSTVATAFLSVPSDRDTTQPSIGVDWLGSLLIIAGLILFVFALTDGSHAPNKWSNPYIYSTLVVGLLTLGAAFYVEGWKARTPLIPFEIFKVPYLKPFFLGLLFSYGTLGVFLLYTTLYMHDIMGATPVQISAWFVPMCCGGVLLSILGGYVLHMIPGTYLIIISCAGWIASSLLFALAPTGANYWAIVFPAMIGATVGIDITFNVANIFVSTNMSSRSQGLAGAMMNSLLYLGIAILLAFADVIQVETVDRIGLKASYQAVFWYMLGCSLLSLAIMVLFVRIPKAQSGLTFDERQALVDNSGLDMAASTGTELTSVDQTRT